jgi:hypothetical protein
MTNPELPYDSFAIFPAINVARIGNAEDYYVGSEIPGVYVGSKFRKNWLMAFQTL